MKAVISGHCRRYMKGAPKPDQPLLALTSGSSRSGEGRSPPQAEVAEGLANDRFGEPSTAIRAA